MSGSPLSCADVIDIAWVALKHSAAGHYERVRHMTDRYSFQPPGGGTDFDWSNDHIFIKVTGGDSGGAYTVVEDNLKSGFALGLHVHHRHAETFYILEGCVDFYVDGAWISAEKGACLHVPAGVPHAAIQSPGAVQSKMLMIFQPAGFDAFLSEVAGMSEADLADADNMTALSERYDIFQLGPVPERPA